MTVGKHVTIKDKHQKWIEEKHINLSRFVQAKIDEEIKNVKGKM